jgi:hypothetical protein
LKKVPSLALCEVTVLSKIHRGNMVEVRQPVRQHRTMRTDSQRKLLAEIIFYFNELRRTLA